MRVTRTASAVVALALSGSLALGAAGAAFATGPAVPQSPTTTAQEDRKPLTAEQFRVVERLGELTRLTGALGRLVQSSDADQQALKSLQNRLTERTQAVEKAVARTKIRPASAPGARETPRLADASAEFTASVKSAVTVERADREARSSASAGLLAGLAKVHRAATAEAGLPGHLFRPQQPSRPDTGSLMSAAERGTPASQTETLRDVANVLTPVTDLLKDVQAAERGKLSSERISEHAQVLEAAFGAAQRNGAGADGERAAALVKLQMSSKSLLRAAAGDDKAKTDKAVRKTIAASTDFLAGTLSSGDLTGPGGRTGQQTPEAPRG